MDSTLVVTLLTTAIVSLAAAITFLFKLHYIDTRGALKNCEDRHNKDREDFHSRLAEEQLDCEKRLIQYQAVIDKLQSRLDDLYTNMVPHERRRPMLPPPLPPPPPKY